MDVKIPYKDVVYLLRVESDFICVSCENAKPLKGETWLRSEDVVDGYPTDFAIILREWARHAKQL